jgi:ABC-type nitrate/sulfonate/bicarbonate transport system substrate-binding protein
MSIRVTSTLAGAAVSGALLLAMAGGGPAAAADKKLSLAVPGVPPIFASVVAIVADQQGYFKKHGADVEVKYFESGTAAERAAVTGGVDLALAPTPLLIAQNSNAGVDLVGIYGMPNPDFLIATTDPGRASCKDLVGQSVGVDAVGGARAVALAQMLAPCGVKIEQVEQVVLPSSATTSAMISDHLTFGVIHADEIAVLETQGKKVGIITTIAKASPNSHFAMIVARRKDLEADRQAYVRLVAGLIEAAHFLADPKNDDRAAALAAPTGRTPSESKGGVQQYREIGFWPAKDDGLGRAKLEALIAIQAKNGAIRPDKTLVSYDKLVDSTIWRDAAAMVGKR